MDCKPIPHKVWSQHPAEVMLAPRGDFKTFTAPHYPLPPDKVRFVGEAVAMVVAKSVGAAKDGAERVAIDYEMLPAVTDTREAAESRRAAAVRGSRLQRRGRRRARRRRRRPRPPSPAPPMW